MIADHLNDTALHLLRELAPHETLQERNYLLMKATPCEPLAGDAQVRHQTAAPAVGRSTTQGDFTTD